MLPVDASLGPRPWQISSSGLQATPHLPPAVPSSSSSEGSTRRAASTVVAVPAAVLVAAWSIRSAARHRRCSKVALRSGKKPDPRLWNERLEERNYRSDEEVWEMVEKLKLPPRPDRIPDIGKMKVKRANMRGGPTDEEIEAAIEDLVPSPQQTFGNQYNVFEDNPLDKGIDVMIRRRPENLICCRGCGIPLQVHDPSNVGFVRPKYYIQMRQMKLHRTLLCTRCVQLEQGQLVPVVKETLGLKKGEEAMPEHGFGGHVVPAEVLTKQLMSIRQRKCLVIYIMDVLDFNGSYVRNIREIVGPNPVIVIGTKIDLLPPKTDLERVEGWLRYALKKKKFKVLDVKLVSSVTGKGVGPATKTILQNRKGLDAFVVGAANAGKSRFIHLFLEKLEEKFPDGMVEECMRPVVSSVPGTTLGTIPLRCFRKSSSAMVFSTLYDTPGVHQPNSMQNLLPIEAYHMVQPTRQFGVTVKSPAKDILSCLKSAVGLPTAEQVQQWLGKPIRYLWGFPRQPPVAAIEVYPPVSAMLQLSFVACSNLAIVCQAGLNPTPEGDSPDPPEGMSLASIAYVDTPEALSREGEVLADVSLAGFGWVAVSMAAISAAAEGRKIAKSKIVLKVFGPKGLKVKMGKVPMPVSGLPGVVPEPPEDPRMENAEEWPQEEQLEGESDVDDGDRIQVEGDPRLAPPPLPQPWAEGLVGRFGAISSPIRETSEDADDQAAAESRGQAVGRKLGSQKEDEAYGSGQRRFLPKDFQDDEDEEISWDAEEDDEEEEDDEALDIDFELPLDIGDEAFKGKRQVLEMPYQDVMKGWSPSNPFPPPKPAPGVEAPQVTGRSGASQPPSKADARSRKQQAKEDGKVAQAGASKEQKEPKAKATAKAKAKAKAKVKAKPEKEPVLQAAAAPAPPVPQQAPGIGRGSGANAGLVRRIRT